MYGIIASDNFFNNLYPLNQKIKTSFECLSQSLRSKLALIIPLKKKEKERKNPDNSRDAKTRLLALPESKKERDHRNRNESYRRG